jgi:hypothetical protein
VSSASSEPPTEKQKLDELDRNRKLREKEGCITAISAHPHLPYAASLGMPRFVFSVVCFELFIIVACVCPLTAGGAVVVWRVQDSSLIVGEQPQVQHR